MVIDVKGIIEIIAIVIILVALIGIFCNRAKQNKGIGKRIIQLAAVFFLIPTILILSLEKLISSETLGTLLGTIIGYVLSDLAKDDKDN